jgi:hypothetical protein
MGNEQAKRIKRMSILTELTQAFSDAVSEHNADKEEALNAAMVFVGIAYANVLEEYPAIYSELRPKIEQNIRHSFDLADQAAALCLDS